jgi:hypothetical protein
MKTIKHRTTVNSVDGKSLPEELFEVTDLSVPETADDVLSLMSTEDGLKQVIRWITDSLKLERNGEIRPIILARAGLGKVTKAVRDKILAYILGEDLARGMEIVRLSGKAKDEALDSYYAKAPAEVRQNILSL